MTTVIYKYTLTGALKQPLLAATKNNMRYNQIHGEASRLHTDKDSIVDRPIF
jgi:hypothetical protein